MRPVPILLLAAAAAYAQSGAPAESGRDLAMERQQAAQLINQGQCLAALPLAEDLVAANPGDAAAQGWLGYCLFIKSRTNAAPAEVPALRQRAREAAMRARQLGNKWNMLNDLFAILDTPGAAEHPYSSNAEANAKMKEGEEAFAKGDNDAALAAYAGALKLDPRLYSAALFSGDVCFRKKDLACASQWFGKAVAIDPAHETAYRYWGDALMAAGKMVEAREKFIEAVIAEPSQKPWAGLQNWAKRNNCQLSAPKVERPRMGDDPHKLELDPNAIDDKDGTGRSAWIGYSIARTAWRQAIFAQKYPNESQYRHTLAEEVAALNAVADAIARQQAPHLDPQLANVASLKRDGLLEAWILISGGPDPGIAQDYAAYRDAHHVELRAYFDKYIIHPASQ
jgi:tetratricopeptide (TPR) repeat protein